MKNMFNKKVFSSWLLVFLTCLLLFNVINLKNNVMRYYFLHFFDYVNKYEKREGFEGDYVYYSCNINDEYRSGYINGESCNEDDGIFVWYANYTERTSAIAASLKKYVYLILDITINDVEYNVWLMYNYMYEGEYYKDLYDTLEYSIHEKNNHAIDNKDGGLPENFGFELVKEKINNQILAPVFKDTKFTPNDWGMFNCNPIYYDSPFYRRTYE